MEIHFQNFEEEDASVYKPSTLVLMITDKCTTFCDHCDVMAGPKNKKVMSLDMAFEYIGRAKIVKPMRDLLIFGGEPMIYYDELVSPIIEYALASNWSVQIATNGFWGNRPEYVKKVLSELNMFANRHNSEFEGDTDARVGLAISHDKYHRKRINPKSIANIIVEYKKGNYSGLFIGLGLFTDKDSLKASEEIFDRCHEQGIYMPSANDESYVYPTLREEIVEFAPENYARIVDKLKKYATLEAIGQIPKEKDILDMIALTNRYSPGSIIARHFEVEGKEADYLIFPDLRYAIDWAYERELVNAGRAKFLTGDPVTRMGTTYSKPGSKNLIITPDDRAYAYPAQIAENISPVEIGEKNFIQVMIDVGQQMKRLKN